MSDQPSSPSLNDLNLDRLHVQWILGKNRGVEQPLVKEQLIQLLEAKRLHWNQLNKAEQRELIDDKNLVEQVEEWTQAKQDFQSNNHKPSSEESMKKAANAASIIVKGLSAILQDELSNKVGKAAWNQLTVKEKEYALNGYFQYIYGVSGLELHKLITNNFNH